MLNIINRRKSIYLPERDLILYLLRWEYFRSYYEYIDLQHVRDNFRELHYLYLAVAELHKAYPETDHDLAALQTFFFVQYPDCDRELYTSLFETLAETQLDPEVGVGILKQIKRRQQALKLSEEAVKFATGYSDVDAVIKMAKFLEEEYVDDLDEIETVSDDLEFLLSETVQKTGLRWRLNCLNKSLGSLRKGNFGFIFARPETGKTTFLASECSHMLTQLGDDAGPVIWFNNEQVGNEVMLRVYQGFFGERLETLMANPKKFNKDFKERGRGKFKLVDDANMDKARVEKICKQLKPSLVIFDQIDKVKGFAADREDLRLGAIYVWARELAKQYCPVIGVCQADGSAENQKWLTMENVSNAKTSKQAEADWILGIGKIHAEGTEHTRYLNISKNKLLGDTDTNPELRHGRFETYIEQNIARYRDIVNYD
jgi:KaiC/GvpD/RAD55 family RecA-like ATPase